MPNDVKFDPNKPVDSKEFKKKMTEFAKKHPQLYAKNITHIAYIGEKMAFYLGANVGPNDLKVDDRKVSSFINSIDSKMKKAKTDDQKRNILLQGLSKATDLGIKYTTNFDDILSCDIITIHTPKNSETINIIDEEQIAKMKDGVILINCARGGLYNEDALYNNLKSGKIAMAGIDVFNKEPATNNKLLDLPNIIVTAHLGANTVESQYKIATQAANNAIKAARGVGYPHALNLPIDETKIPPFVKPYLELTQKMAFLIAQMNKNTIQSIKIEAQGEISTYLDSLETFAIVGALTHSLSNEKINYVNATFVASQRDIKVESIALKNTSAFKNQITIKITTTNSVNSTSGTIFDDEVQRIVKINDFIMDIEPSGKMILFTNSDVPGVIGSVGNILASDGINIADFRLGRNKNGALAVIVVDEDVSNSTLEKLKNLEAAKSVSYAQI
jgi:D-3-phosphoglycerate dehydrogenase